MKKILTAIGGFLACGLALILFLYLIAGPASNDLAAKRTAGELADIPCLNIPNTGKAFIWQAGHSSH